jgi:hypothetical protein
VNGCTIPALQAQGNGFSANGGWGSVNGEQFGEMRGLAANAEIVHESNTALSLILTAMPRKRQSAAAMLIISGSAEKMVPILEATG